jgi:hypothetical protein
MAKYVPGGRELGDKLGRFAQFSGQCVEERMNSGVGTGRKDLLYYFTERQQKNPEIMRPLDVHIEANSAVYSSHLEKTDGVGLLEVILLRLHCVRYSITSLKIRNVMPNFERN